MDDFFLELLLAINLIVHLAIWWDRENEPQALSSIEYHLSEYNALEKFTKRIEILIHESEGRNTHTILNIKSDIRGLTKAVEDQGKKFDRHFKTGEDET